MKKKLVSILAALGILMGSLLSTVPAFADIMVGDSVVSLGQNLTEAQRQALIKEFGATDETMQIEVTNAEEYEYLGDTVPAAKIGRKAISSAMITYTKPGSGLNVTLSPFITYITPQTYENALITAGVKDADIQVSAPMNVSGTAALTGIMKAYETSSGKKIDSNVKKIANEEMVRTQELGDSVGNEKANEVMNSIKEQIAEKQPKTKEEVQTIINNTVNNYNIQLTQEQKDQLVSLFDKMKGLNIDWNQVKTQAGELAGKTKDYLASDEGQGFLQGIGNAFKSFFDWIASLFR